MVRAHERIVCQCNTMRKRRVVELISFLQLGIHSIVQRHQGEGYRNGVVGRQLYMGIDLRKLQHHMLARSV
jgi:hypothetical protein